VSAAPVALSFHALRFDAPLADDGEFPRPAAVPGVGGVEVAWDAAGHAHPDARWWLWLAGWPDEDAARDAVRSAPDWLPGHAAAGARWSAALRPYLSKGLVNWRGAPAAPCAAQTSRPHKDEPVVTLTTFGVARDRAALRGFGERMFTARAALRSAPGLVAEFEINAVVPAAADPCTVTLWVNEAAAMTFAYRNAPHRPAMEWAQAGEIFQRSSFTRCTVLATAGALPGRTAP
jgi:hypothetical protein